MIFLPLQTDSLFSHAVFERLRTHVPKNKWPSDSTAATFTVAGDGLWLKGEFDDFPHTHRQIATDLVKAAGVDLVLKSPAAGLAQSLLQARRWRDVALYAFVPILFFMPIAGAFSHALLPFLGIALCADLIALLVRHGILVRRRAEAAASRLVAHIPAPGIQLHLDERRPQHLAGLDGIPEV